MSQEQEPLVYLPPERWSELQSAFKRNWPRGVGGFLLLETQRDWLEKGFLTDFKVYCPYGDVQSGMVALNEKSDFYEVNIQCPGDDLEKLREALSKTKVVDWRKSIIVPIVPNNIVEMIKSLVQDMPTVEIEEIIHSMAFILDTKTPYEVDLPADMTFGLLTNKHLDLVNSTWPHSYSSAYSYFKLLIDYKYGYGLFLNNELTCWLLINESGNLLHVYTVKEHRRKGYADLLLKLVGNILIKDGKIVCAYCVADNIGASKLYTRTGFARMENSNRCFLRSTIK